MHSAKRRPSLFLFLFISMAFVLLLGVASAQEPESTPDPVQPQPTPSFSFEPQQVLQGREQVLSIFGQDLNFTSTTTLRLVGYGLIPVQLVNGSALTAALGATVPAGVYQLELSDPVQGFSLLASTSLQVIAPTATPVPTATPLPPPELPVVPTLTIPTPIPQTPSLYLRRFAPSSATLAAGQSASFNLEIFNQGTRTAEGVVLSFELGGDFAPSNGQATLSLPNIAPNSAHTLSLPLTANVSAASGLKSAIFNLNYRDNTGATYTGKLTLPITVQAVSLSSQVTLARYLSNPTIGVPSQGLELTLLFTNTGNLTASQLLVRLPAESPLLMAGAQGDSVVVGDLPAGASLSVSLPLIVKNNAPAGIQSQSFDISYTQNGTAVTSKVSVALEIARHAAPLLMLDHYETETDFLTPGQRFTLKLRLKNMGGAPARQVLLVFGSVSSGDGGNATPDANGGSGGTNTSSSTTFAILGSGGTQFLDEIPANGGTLEIEQSFIASGTVESGIYSLPISLRYLKPDGGTAIDTLNASLVVVRPPLLGVALQAPLTPFIEAGMPQFIAIDLTNQGAKALALLEARVLGDNIDVLEGASAQLSRLQALESSTLNVGFIGLMEGRASLTLEIDYLDDLNQVRTLRETYTLEVTVPPPIDIPLEPTQDPNLPPPTPPAPSTDDLIGRILLGLLGLGS